MFLRKKFKKIEKKKKRKKEKENQKRDIGSYCRKLVLLPCPE